MITTVKYKMYADYEVREIVVFDVSGLFWASFLFGNHMHILYMF